MARFRFSNSGYKQYNSGSGWKFTHRTVAEKTLGNSIPQGHHVHHVNGNKLDNRPSNLQVMPASDHIKQHK